MEYDVEILSSAKVQIAEALEYYSEINELLPEKFLEKLDLTCGFLRTNPYFQKRYKNIRGIPMTNFPFILLYTIEEDKKQVRIVSCFQTFQDPEKYPK